MIQTEFVVKDPAGIHARPAGLMRIKAGEFSSKIIIATERGKADARNPIAVLGLKVKCKDRITVIAEGEDEKAAVCAIEEFLREYL